MTFIDKETRGGLCFLAGLVAAVIAAAILL